MSFETAKKIIDNELKFGTPKENTYLDFFGGEPFLNFKLIKQIYEYVISFYRGKIRFCTCTNGTLVHGEVQSWLKAHKNFTVGLSADGVKIAHDLNRSNSFDDIDFDFFLENYPSQPVKTTVSAESLPYLAESVIFLTEKGFPVSCNLAYNVDWSAADNRTVLEDQLEKLIAYYIDNPDRKKCRMLDLGIESLSRPQKNTEKMRKYCGTGVSMVCYATDGKAYPCQLFAPLSAGEAALPLENCNITREYDKALLPEECRECYYLRICPICLGCNYLKNGDMYKSDKNRCELYKIIFKANAKLKALEWDKGLLKLDGQSEQALLRSILAIQNL